jgi:hypothetical protein
MLRAIWSHNTSVSRATNFSPFQLLFEDEEVTLEEIKHKSSQAMPEAIPCPTEAEDKDLLELDRLNAKINLQKYQAETMAWRGTEVKQRTFDVRDLILLWSPHTESFGKLESKWVGSYAVIENSRPGAYHLSDSQGRMLDICGTRTIFFVFTFKQVVKREGLVSYKRAFVVECSITNLLSVAHTLFLKRETRQVVRFLMRRSLYILKS